MPTKNLDEWFSHIQQLHHKRMDFTLARIDNVADRLNLKTFSCPVITVAGTNGKGSCVKTLESIYVAAGYQVGLYTSPHLLEFNERIRIYNKNISDAQLIRAFRMIEKAREEITLSFFEYITLAALYLFQQTNLDVIILEVGLGGRLDAVNIVESDIAVVTSIALDHQEYLGNDRESIAFEKASIARAQKYLVCGEEDPPDNIAKTVAAKNAILFQINRDFTYDEVASQQMEVLPPATAKFKHNSDFFYQFLTPHLKPQNIATAIAAIHLMQKKLPVSKKNIQDGVKNTIWPGRFEMISSPFSCILDVAHNPQASAWLAKQVAQLPAVKKTIAIVGMLKDKEMIETIKPMLPLVDLWCVCSLLSASSDRGSDGVVTRDFLHSQKIDSCYTFNTVADALDFVSTRKADRVLIFGSFYTVADAKKWLALKSLPDRVSVLS